MTQYPNFIEAITAAALNLRDYSDLVHTDKWQGVDISQAPEMATHEFLNFSFSTPLFSSRYENYVTQIEPNLPWADDHFLERIGGQPINPGEEWKRWPWGQNARKFLDERGQFNHNYMERYWPKFATQTPTGKLTGKKVYWFPNQGLRHELGDLDDVVNHLAKDPMSRQAYFPVFFPEDTGVVHGERIPCSLGHHFIMRNGLFHHVYYIRSCDFIRHFRDDIYLSLRLHLWVLERLKKAGEAWRDVRPGTFTMHTTSLHMFRNDYLSMFGPDARQEEKAT